MRPHSLVLLALTAVVVSEEQAPLMDRMKGWFGKAQSYISTISTAVPTPSNPVKAATQKILELKVTPLTRESWTTVLSADIATSSTEPDEWMIFVTGGNKTCDGRCGNATLAWNHSIPLLSVESHPPKLAILDCEMEPVLCNSWLAHPPAIWHVLLPRSRPDQSGAEPTVRILPLNTTSIDSSEIMEIHTKQKYLEQAPYEGIFHPFNGFIHHYHLGDTVGYIMYSFSRIPTWASMIVVSLVSRSLMNKQLSRHQQRQQPPRQVPVTR